MGTEVEASESSKDASNTNREASEASSSAVHATQTIPAVSSKTTSSTTADRSADDQRGVVQAVPSQSLSTTATPSIASNSGLTPEPAAKRRKLNQTEQAQHETHVANEDHNIQLVVPAEANRNIAQDRRITEADTISTRSQRSNIPLPGSATKDQRKKNLEAAAAEVVAEATRASDKRAKKSGSVSKLKNPRKAANPKRKATAITATSGNTIENGNSTSKSLKGRRGRKPREPTPDGAEDKRIIPGEVKMADLCKDNRQGRKSMREKTLQERDKEELAKQKQQEICNLVGESDMTQPNGPAAEQQAANPVSGVDTAQHTLEDDNTRRVPGTQIIGDEIMISDDQQLDFHKEAAEQREREQLESVDEDDLSRRVNSQTYMKREKLNVWSEELTDLFYDGLRMFGTDFGMISKMFPDRTRRAIKLKFTKEEKLHQDRVKEVLWGSRIPVDMEGFSKLTGLTFDDPQTHEREMEEDRKRLEEEAKVDQQFRDAAHKTGETVIEQAAAENDSSPKENKVGRCKGRRDIKTKKSASKKRHRRKRKVVNENGDEVLNSIEKE